MCLFLPANEMTRRYYIQLWMRQWCTHLYYTYFIYEKFICYEGYCHAWNSFSELIRPNETLFTACGHKHINSHRNCEWHSRWWHAQYVSHAFLWNPQTIIVTKKVGPRVTIWNFLRRKRQSFLNETLRTQWIQLTTPRNNNEMTTGLLICPYH